MRGHKENILSSIYVPLFQSTLDNIFIKQTECPTTIMATGLDSTGTNNFTGLVAQCTRVLYHKAQLRDLN